MPGNQAVFELHQGPDRSWRGVELVDSVLVYDDPEAVVVGVERGSFVLEGRKGFMAKFAMPVAVLTRTEVAALAKGPYIT